MANSEVSRLKFNDTTYEIADELARESVGTALTEVASVEAKADAYNTALSGRITNLENSSGAVLVAKTRTAMTDTNKIYVYTGTATTASGVTYTPGHWYYHNGSKWTDGGEYNQNLDAIDATLTQSNKGADAKVTGDRLSAAETDISKLRGTIANEYASQVYSVGDYCYHDGLLYRCNTEIAAAEAWTSSHWTAVDVMPEISNLKNDTIPELKDALYDSNSVNAIAASGSSFVFNNGTSAGVTYTWDTDYKSCHATGTASGTSLNRIYYSTTTLPACIQAGGVYKLRISTTTTNLYLQVYYYDSSGTQGTAREYRANSNFSVPNTAVGCMMRLRVTSGATVDDTLTLSGIFTAVSNKELQENVSDLQSRGLMDIISGNYLPNNTDIDTLVGVNQMWLTNSSSSMNYPNLPWDPTNFAGIIGSFYVRNYTLQVGYCYDNTVHTRRYNHNTETFSTWKRIAGTTYQDIHNGVYLASGDADDYWDNNVYFVSTPNTIDHLPATGAGMFLIYKLYNFTIQLFIYGITTTPVIAVRRGNQSNETWTVWKTISGGSGTTYDVTVEQTINQYTTTNNVTCNPTITTDINNYLASSGNTIDRAPDIISLLTSTGTCHLGPGVFWVSGVDMPDGSAITGSGPATKVYLLGSGDGYAIKCGNKCAVKDMTLYGQANDATYGDYSGSNSPVWPEEAPVVERHGIVIAGTYLPPNVSGNLKGRVILSNLYIANFAGGAIAHYGTGSLIYQGVEAVNIYIWHCYAGIYNKFLAEFANYTNIKVIRCHYGAIVNSGNQYYVSCNFMGNLVNLWMDDSLGQSENNSHGSFSSCCFLHAAPSNTGTNILLQGLDYGEVFSACDIFFGSVIIENCIGITFSGCEFGTSIPISIDGGSLILFGTCIFRSSPVFTITNNNNVNLNNCYLTSGAEVTL